MGIIAFIILGAIAGAVAKALLPGEDPGGFIITTLIGIVGAILGGFLAAALFGADPVDHPAPDLSRRRRARWHTRDGLARGLEGEGLAAAREPAHGRQPPAVLAPDVREDAQRLRLDLVDVEAASLAPAVRAGLAEAGRDRDDDGVLALRRRQLELATLGDGALVDMPREDELERSVG